MHTTPLHSSESQQPVRAGLSPAFEIKHHSELTPGDHTCIKDWMHQAWPQEADPYAWRRLDWHVLVRVDGELASQAEVSPQAITVDGHPMQVGALGSVYTPEGRRGSGLATAAMLRAQEFICSELGMPFALLLCEADLIPFYSRIGWTVAEGPLIFDQPPDRLAKLAGLQPGSAAPDASGQRSTVTWPDEVMVYSCSGDPWPSGVIDLCGLPW